MNKLVVTAFITLDGVMQAPGGPDEDRSGGFEHGGWVVPFFDDMVRFATERFELAGAVVLGRKTYEIFASHWPLVTDPTDKIAVALNSLPKHVASTTLTSVDWRNSTLIKGDVVAAVRDLKESVLSVGSEVQVHGSCGLLQTLLRHDLVDELHLLTFPVVLGSGHRLFESGAAPVAFKLTNTSTSSTGITMNSFERTGVPGYGYVGLEPQ